MKLRLFTVILFALLGTSLRAQCTYQNRAFQPGEFLSYNLYYNWKFVWVKAGTASMYTVQSRYQGRPAYRASLITRGNRRVDNLFVLRDTLLSYSSLALEPLYFRKGAREGRRYTVDEVFYHYPGRGSSVNLKQHRLDADGINHWVKRNLRYCVFDMLNIFLRARNFDPAGWRGGHEVDFPIVDGNSLDAAKLRYQGKVKVKADNGHTYRCLRLAYMEKEKGKWKRIVDFYVSDDQNHIPVRLDLFLRFGSAKAFLVGLKGIRNPLRAQIK